MIAAWSASPAEVRLGAGLPVVGLLLSLLWPARTLNVAAVVLLPLVVALAIAVVARRRLAWRVMVVSVLLWSAGDVLTALADDPALGSLSFLIDAAALWFLTRRPTRHWVAQRGPSVPVGASG